MTDFPEPTLAQMIDELKLSGSERRDHIENVCRAGGDRRGRRGRSEEEIQWRQSRLHVFRAAVLMFISMARKGEQ